MPSAFSPSLRLSPEDDAVLWRIARQQSRRACAANYPHLLDDAEAHAYVGAWKAFRAGAGPATLAFGARNACVDFLRAEYGRNHGKSALVTAIPFSALPAWQDSGAAWPAIPPGADDFGVYLQPLRTPRHRRVLALRYEAGLTRAEIAAQVGVSESRVVQLEEEALAQLKVLLVDPACPEAARRLCAHCGRPAPAEAFPVDSRTGRPGGTCVDCVRTQNRESAHRSVVRLQKAIGKGDGRARSYICRVCERSRRLSEFSGTTYCRECWNIIRVGIRAGGSSALLAAALRRCWRSARDLSLMPVELTSLDAGERLYIATHDPVRTTPGVAEHLIALFSGTIPAVFVTALLSTDDEKFSLEAWCQATGRSKATVARWRRMIYGAGREYVASQQSAPAESGKSWGKDFAVAEPGRQTHALA